MRLLSITLLFVATASVLVSTAQAQDPKSFYETLARTPVTVQTYPAAVQAANQIATLSKAEVQDLIPTVFAAIKDDTDGSKHAVLGLYAVSKRPDSGELLKPHMKSIAALLTHSDPAFKATAGHILMNMHPQPPEAADILLGFIYGPTGAANEKIDAFAALTRLQNPPKNKLEVAAIQILKQPMDARTTSAAINAAAYPGASDALVDALAQHLNHTDWQVRGQTILALRRLGAGAVAKHRGELAKLANDSAQPDPIRQFAQNTLDGNSEKCVSLQTHPTPQLVPIPGCKVN